MKKVWRHACASAISKALASVRVFFRGLPEKVKNNASLITVYVAAITPFSGELFGVEVGGVYRAEVFRRRVGAGLRGVLGVERAEGRVLTWTSCYWWLRRE